MTTYSYSSPGGVAKITVGTTGQLQAGRYDIVAYGASGGAVGRNSGGYGAEEGGYFNLAQGDKLEIIAAGAGKSSQAGSGGGASQVFISRNGGAYVPLVIAGGGGGAGTDQGVVGGDATVGAPGNGDGGFGGNRGGGGAGALSNGGSAGTAGGGYDIANGGGGGRGGSFQPGGFGGGGGGDGGGGGGYTGGNGGGAGFKGYGGTSFVSTTYGAPDPSHTRSGTLGVTGNGMVVFTPICFVSGTSILTTRGEVPVEDLRVGDLAITASGPTRSIRWLGHRTVDVRCHPRPREAIPICIAAHALGESRPARDLLVSPGHSICVDVLGEVLIPAIALVNGTTVCQVEADAVTYWHVELDSHDVILAENLPCESYLDMGNRGFFRESAVVGLGASPDADPARRTHADFCRPFVDGGPVLEAVRSQMCKRASAVGWTLIDDLDRHHVDRMPAALHHHPSGFDAQVLDCLCR